MEKKERKMTRKEDGFVCDISSRSARRVRLESLSLKKEVERDGDDDGERRRRRRQQQQLRKKKRGRNTDDSDDDDFDGFFDEETEQNEHGDHNRYVSFPSLFSIFPAKRHGSLDSFYHVWW